MPTPNVTVVGGNYNTGTDNASTFVRDVDTKLFYLESFKYPLTAALFTMGTELEKKASGDFELRGKQVRKKATVNPKFEHTESENLKFSFNPTVAVAAADGTITVSTSDDDYFVAGDELLLTNASGQKEVARITVVASALLTVTRNIGSTGAIVMTTGDFFYKMGTVRAQDSVSTDARQTKGETLYNFIEFLSETYGVSVIEKATANYHGDPFKRAKMEALSRMKQRLEMMFWFGVRSVDSATTNPIHHNGGIFYWLENQFTDVAIRDVGGILTKQEWDLWLQDALKYNSGEKWVFCSSPVLAAVNGFATNQLRVTDVNLKKFGMSVVDYQSPFGLVHLVYEPLFDEVAVANGKAVCLDLANVSWRYLEGNGVNLDLKSYDDIQENDRSAQKGEWITVGGIDIANGRSHSILERVDA